MKSLMKWLVVICVVGWAVHNPAETASDVHMLVVAGQSLVSSLAGAVGGGSSSPGTAGNGGH